MKNVFFFATTLAVTKGLIKLLIVFNWAHSNAALVYTDIRKCILSQTGFALLVVLYRVHTKHFNDFSRTFQGPPTRNIISQNVQKCRFPVYSNKALRLELFASPSFFSSLVLNV